MKTLIFRPIPESSARVAELFAGGVDIISNVPPDQAEQIEKSDIARLETVTGGRRIFIAFNQIATGPGSEAVRDKRVRQALNYAVDVDTILKNLFYGRGEREGGMVNPPHKNPAVQPYPYDPEKAKQLLAEAGYPNGFQVTMSTPNGRYQKDKEIALAVASDLAKVGVVAEVVPMDWTLYTTLLRSKEFPPMFLLGAGSSFLSAWYDLADLVSPVVNPNNFPSWQNDDWDVLVDKLGKTIDPAERKVITDEMQLLIHEEAPWLFIYMQVDWYAVNKKLDWHAPKDERMNFLNVKWLE